jgi:hypothetical protein
MTTNDHHASGTLTNPAADAAAMLLRLGFAIFALVIPSATLMSRWVIVVLVPIGAVLIILSSLLRADSARLSDRALSRLASGPGLACLLLVSWALVSLLWTPVRGEAVEKLFKLLGVVSLGFFAVIALPQRMRATNLHLITIGVALGATLILVGSVSALLGQPVLRFPLATPERVVILLTVLGWIGAAWLLIKNRRSMAFALMVLVIAAIALGPNRAAFGSLAQQHPDGLQHVQWLEAGDDHGFAVLAGHALVGGAPNDRGHMARTDEAVDARRSGAAENGVHGRRGQHVVAQHRKIGQALGLGLQQCHRGGRSGGLETDGQEHHFPIGVFTGPLQGLQWRGDHAHLCPQGLGLAQAEPVRGRNPQHIAIGADGDFWLLRQGNGLIDPSDREHAHRAAGAMDELQPLGQQVLQAMARQGVGVAPAEFHQAHLARFGHGLRDRTGEPLCEREVAEVFQRVQAACGTHGWGAP